MEEKVKKSDEKVEDEYYPFHHFVRRMMLAGMGALSYSHEEMEKFINKMVERGEVAQKSHEARMKRIRERREEFMHDRKGYTQKRVEKALDHFEVPSKKDIDEMNAKISMLEKKIDELKKKPE